MQIFSHAGDISTTCYSTHNISCRLVVNLVDRSLLSKGIYHDTLCWICCLFILIWRSQISWFLTFMHFADVSSFGQRTTWKTKCISFCHTNDIFSCVFCIIAGPCCWYILVFFLILLFELFILLLFIFLFGNYYIIEFFKIGLYYKIDEIHLNFDKEE